MFESDLSDVRAYRAGTIVPVENYTAHAITDVCKLMYIIVGYGQRIKQKLKIQ